MQIPMAQISKTPPPKEVAKGKPRDLISPKQGQDFETVAREHLRQDEAKMKNEENSDNQIRVSEKEKLKTSTKRTDLISSLHLALALQDGLISEEDLQNMLELTKVGGDDVDLTLPIEEIGQGDLTNLLANLDTDDEIFLAELSSLLAFEAEADSDTSVSFKENVVEMDLVDPELDTDLILSGQEELQPSLEGETELELIELGQEELSVEEQIPGEAPDIPIQVDASEAETVVKIQPEEQTLRQRSKIKNASLRQQEPGETAAEPMVIKGKNGIPLLLTEEYAQVAEEPVESVDVQTVLQDFISTVKFKASLPKMPTAVRISEPEIELVETTFEAELDSELEDQVSAFEKPLKPDLTVDQGRPRITDKAQTGPKENFTTQVLGNATSQTIQNNSGLEQVEFEQLETMVLDLQEPEKLVPKLVQNIQSLVQAERSEVRIDLKPDHFGELKIKLSLERGIMVAEFTVENEAVQAIIASELPQLQTALQDQGANVAEMMVNIGFGQKEQNDDGESRSKHFANQSRTNSQTRRVSVEGEDNKLGRTKWNQVDVKV